MKPIYFLFSVSLVLLALTGQTQTPATYYVDGSLSTNGDGSAAHPWNRIWYAINRTRDTTREAVVYIKRGTYTIDSTDFLTQLFIGAANGGINGKYLTLRPYTGDEGKVIIDGSRLATNSFFPNMLVISGASYVKLQHLVFRGLRNTTGYGVNVQNSQYVQVNNCVFDSLRWTTTASEYGYPTVNNNSYFIHSIYVANSANVSLSADTLRNSALGWGTMVRDAGGNTSLTTSALVQTGNASVASQYYVALSGNDTSGNGSLEKPWRTVRRAIDLAGINYTYSPAKLIESDVTVNLRAGTHKPVVNGLFIGSNRGLNSKWFILRNYPGENAILDGSQITAKFSALLSITDARFIRIEGLKFTKMTSDSLLQYASPSPGIKDTRFGILVSGKCSNIVIKKNTIYDMAWTRNVTLQKTPTPSDNLNPLIILGTTDTAIRNVIIDSNTVYENVPGYSEAVTVNGNVDSFAITNNLVFDNANIGIVAAGNYKWIVDDPNFTVTNAFNYSRNGYIRGNTVYRNISPIAVSAGIYLDGSRNVVVEANLSYKNGTGMSIGNEQFNSVSGYHLVQSNVFRDNLTAGLYFGSTNVTSWVENCTVKDNTIKNNYIQDSALRARANNQYGITSPSQRYTEVNIYRLRNSVFEQNTVESLSDIVLGLYYTQADLTLRYNTYYVISENACQATFVEDKNNDGSIVLPTDSIYSSFHRYALRTGYDRTSESEGQVYSATGCGMLLTSIVQDKLTNWELSEPVDNITVYPNPAAAFIQVQLWAKKSGTAQLRLYNLNGSLVRSQHVTMYPGYNQVKINNLKQQGIKPGTYLLTLTSGNETKQFKVVVQ